MFQNLKCTPKCRFQKLKPPRDISLVGGHSFFGVCLSKIHIFPLLVLCNDPCEAKHEMQSVFKFSDVLFALKSDGPPVDEAFGQVDIFCQIFGSG